MATKLTNKQSTFCKEYLVDLNATQAAIRAGYSEKTANEQGSRLLANVSIQNAIQEAMDARSKKVGVTAEWVLAEIQKVAALNFQDLYDEDGVLIEIHKLPREVAAAVSQIEINLTEGCAAQKVKTHDKLKALEMLGRHLILFTDKTESNVSMKDVEITVRRAGSELQ